MDFTLTHRGIPIGIAHTGDARGLAVIEAKPLPAVDAIRSHIPKWTGVRVTAIGARGLSESVEWHDERGTVVPAARVDIWLAAGGQLLVFTTFDPLAAGVPAVMPPYRRSGFGEDDG